ncbi:hypothetical protein P8452_27141 [Trifolium repens]|nr:hypothetical protein P8452_27141 [Trifolium repens]
MFNEEHEFNFNELADLLHFPHGNNVACEVSDNEQWLGAISPFWRALTAKFTDSYEGNTASSIHNPAIRYFRQLLVCTIFGRTNSNKGLVSFRLFGNTYHSTHREIAEFLGVLSGTDAFTEIQDDTFIESELEYYWGSISENPNSALNARNNTEIHNPAIRYFHMIIAHTFLGKPVSNNDVSREELFMMFCVSQTQPINAATILLTNFAEIIEDPTRLELSKWAGPYGPPE